MRNYWIFILVLTLLVGCTTPTQQPTQPTQTAQPTQPAVATAETGKPTMTPPPAQAKVLNIAHRGARSIAPENTLLAAQKGLDAGADMWELDVAMTAENEMVVIHDDTLERTSNAAKVYPDRRPWNTENFTLAELRKLDFGSWYIATDPFKQIAQGVLKPEDTKAFVNLPIPTLREALEFTKANKWRVNVELKDLTGKPGDASVVEKAVALIIELGMEKDVIISSFNHTYIQRVKAANPKIYTGALVNVQVNDPLALLKTTNADAYNPNMKGLDMTQIGLVRKAGKDVLVWTVNDEAGMRRLIEAGVSGIFTDYPQLLKQVLAAK